MLGKEKPMNSDWVDWTGLKERWGGMTKGIYVDARATAMGPFTIDVDER